MELSMFMRNEYINSSVLATNNGLNENYCCYCYIMLPSLLSLQMCYGICYCCIYVVLFEILDIKAFEFNFFYLHPLHLVKWGRQEWNRNWGV